MSSLHAAAMRLFKRMYSRLASFRDSDCTNPGEAHVAAVLPLIARWQQRYGVRRPPAN
jgi:hypothetical protein